MHRLTLLAWVALVALPLRADDKLIDIWPEGIPGQPANDPAEVMKQDHLYHVHKPTLGVFLPSADKACGTAVILCPGGGYVRLPPRGGPGGEGKWLNDLGVAVFVLTYRLGDAGVPAPLRDVTRAIRIVRSRAAEFHVRPDRIGVFGGSAGGHLAAWASTGYDDPDINTGSPLDSVNARPDFAIMLYPVITMRLPYAHGGSRRALIGDHPTDQQIDRCSMELHVTPATPPSFLVSTEADKSVPQENAMMYYEALMKAKVPAELHLYEKGPHGFGFQKNLGDTSLWPERCETWMRSHQLVHKTRSLQGPAGMRAQYEIPRNLLLGAALLSVNGQSLSAERGTAAASVHIEASEDVHFGPILSTFPFSGGVEIFYRSDVVAPIPHRGDSLAEYLRRLGMDPKMILRAFRGKPAEFSGELQLVLNDTEMKSSVHSGTLGQIIPVGDMKHRSK